MRGFCRRIAGYISRASSGHQGRACVHHQRSGRYSQRESYSTCTPTYVGTTGLQSFCREGVAWKHLRHPNVLPLLGVTVSEYRFAMVFEWMENGNIIDFVGKDKYVNPTKLVRHRSMPTPTSA